MVNDTNDKKISGFQIWGAQIRANFLVLSVILVGIGLALAGWQIVRANAGSFNVIHAILLVVGVVLTHISVNLYNEYSDHQTGIDARTDRTPFSGGSGMMQAGLTRPESVLLTARETLFLAFLIGLYFTAVSHWFIMVIMIIGGIAVVFYTSILARWLLGELFAGLSLGTLVVLGTYIAMTAQPWTPVSALLSWDIILISLPPGILTSLLLLLNEFPDADADREGGRFHMIIWLGKKRAAVVYVAGLILVYGIIIFLPVLKFTSWWMLISLLTLPLAMKAGITAIKHSKDTPKLIPALAMNVLVVLITDALMAVAILVELIVL